MYRLFLAVRYLLTRPINLLGMAGILLSVWALVVVVSIFSGFLQQIEHHVRSASADISVHDLPAWAEWTPLERALRDDPNVAGTARRLVHYGMLSRRGQRPPPPPLLGRSALHGGDQPFLFVLGIDAAAETHVTGFGGWITDNYSWHWVFLINVPVGLLALWLSYRFISDPPFLRRRTGKDRWRGDFIGLSLVGIGLGCLQLGLDLGEREDWFSSPWITAAAVTAGVSLVTGLWWSLRHEDPMVNVRVLAERNLGLSCLHMLIFGAVLYGTTALLPLMAQTQLGYTAMQSGMALSPGGIVVAVLMPFVGFMVTRMDPRWMILLGVGVISASLFDMATFSLQVDFQTLVLARMLQGFGLAFIFVPINTIAYARVTAGERNAASSLMSIARNIGGSIGIGYTSTMVARGTQTHRALLTEHASLYDPSYTGAVATLQQKLLPVLGDPVHTERVAVAMLDQQLEHQASMLAYVEQFRFLAVAFLILVPVVLLMRRQKTPRHVELVVE